jgi:hypothetical protein
MSNGDYDEDILLFERDILLMFTNALYMYDRDVDVHGHAQYMINYVTDLLEVRRSYETVTYIAHSSFSMGDINESS